MIYLGSDHAGLELKEEIKFYLKQMGYEVEDCGAHRIDSTDDYPDFVGDAAKKVASHPNSKGIVLGKSGAGECMAANKIKGVRAFLGITEQNVKLAREHNDANVLSLGSDFVSFKEATNLINIFLNTPFSNEERHVRRIKKIQLLEER